ncbi:hypothetical protein MJO28_015478 [Puccinia striiformis f. sp. tritici]|uniref:Uncharacterized protein n=1 Tax=Puccinia striiformis f. sp. tritici TaxID=168172 RepID=A0ACC0DNV5_9BASI|nr:hypothetical protein MJO28_015478 [Puccinia striiformis f. sp. tritici]
MMNNPGAQDSSSSSKRQLLANKAVNLSLKLLNKSANYLTNNNNSNENSISRQPHQKHKSTSDKWSQDWDNDTSNWNMVVGGQPTTLENSKTPDTANSHTSSSGYLSYFHPQNWQRKSNYTEDHLVCFPGFVALGSPSHSRAGDIELFISIHAFRAKPTLDTMNRSQRLVHSMICKITGLPPLILSSSSTNPEEINNIASMMGSDDDDDDEEQNETMKKYEPLLPSNNIQTNSYSFSDSPSAKTSHSSKPTPIKHTPAKNFSRTSSTSSTRSYRRMLQQEVPDLSKQSPLVDTGVERLIEKFNIEKEDLQTLHFNLKERLHSFFSQKSESSQVRLKLFGVCSSRATGGTISKSLFRSRIEAPNLLTPELAPDEFIINNGRPLLTQVITTKPGGVWSDKLILPWQTIETHLRVNQLQNSTSTTQSPDTGIIRLRIEAELIKDESMITNPTYSKVPESSSSDPLKKDQIYARQLSLGKNQLVMELDVIPALAESVHVISDIDDTIKHTNVLGGLKAVFKNVFLAGFDQVAIVGMAEWYQSLQELGCWMHYISNSPLELWYCIEGFLAANGFPRGSISLKEYARGATSILSGMWESAGSRKRARVESIIRQFPNSKFICVGDSGEQDLEMYVSLAQTYPGRIISIYIRDVTTPAILGKDISIDKVSSHIPTTPAPIPTDRDDDDRMKAPTQIPKANNIMCPSRSDSPSREQFSNRAESADRSTGDNPDHVVPVANKRASQRPIPPPKPRHLSSHKPGFHNNKRLSSPVNRTFNHDHLFDPPMSSPRSASFDISPRQPPPTLDNYFIGDPPSSNPAKLSTCQPITTSPEDIKIQSLLEGFRNRIKKAESDLNQLQFCQTTTTPSSYRSDDPLRSSYFIDQPSIDRSSNPRIQQICLNFTKLKLFRSGADSCVLESIDDVKKVLATNNLHK